MIELPQNKKIILFDGICNLCNTAVQFVIEHDKKDLFRFVALQSNLGQEIAKHIGIDVAKTDSVVLYEPGIAYYIKFEAVLEIVKHLSGGIALLTIFKILPTALQNNLYDYMARNRYKWYGKRESCMIPTPELKTKFL